MSSNKDDKNFDWFESLFDYNFDGKIDEKDWIYWEWEHLNRLQNQGKDQPSYKSYRPKKRTKNEYPIIPENATPKEKYELYKKRYNTFKMVFILWIILFSIYFIKFIIDLYSGNDSVGNIALLIIIGCFCFALKSIVKEAYKNMNASKIEIEKNDNDNNEKSD